jgi:hypothetical protein
MVARIRAQIENAAEMTRGIACDLAADFYGPDHLPSGSAR